MTSRGRQFWILGIWALVGVGAIWLFVGFLFPRQESAEPADDFMRWTGVLLFGVPWLLDLLLVLIIALSLEKRRNRWRLWILGVWSLIVSCIAWIEVFPWLFGLLVALWIVLWIEKRIADRTRLP
jgi:hypothetical protein